MLYSLTVFLTLAIGGPPVESICLQVAPVPPNNMWLRSPNQTRAVVLIHGFYLHLKDKNVSKAALRPWQHADAPLVKELGKTADVFVFAYGQNGSVDAVVEDSNLANDMAQLRKLGYR